MTHRSVCVHAMMAEGASLALPVPRAERGLVVMYLRRYVHGLGADQPFVWIDYTT
jgi:hypothetical protein